MTDRPAGRPSLRAPRYWGAWAATAAVAALFLLFFFAPLALFYVRAAGGANAADLISVVFSSRTKSALSFSVGQAMISAAVAVVVAMPGAYLVSHYRFPGRRLIYSLSLVPFVLPSIIVVVAMISFYGKSGVVNRILGTDLNLVYNFAGIVIAHVYYNVSLALRVLAGAWAGIDRRYRESAESLGDSRRGIFRRITLPLLMPAVATGFLLVFIYSFLSFGIVLVFGGVRYATLEVAIYREMYVNLDLSAAGVLSGVQLAVSALFLAISSRAIHRDRGGIAGSAGSLPRLSGARRVERTLLSLYALFLFLFILGPLVTMAGRSLVTSHGGFGLENYRELLVPSATRRSVRSILRSSVGGVVARSVLIATASGTLTFVVAVFSARSLRGGRNRWIENILQFPVGVSLVSVGLGLRLLWPGSSPALVVMGQLFVAFPVVFRILRSGVEEMGDRIIEAAEVLGAGPFRIFREIEYPLLRRTYLNAYAYALALPFADLTMVMTVGRGRIATFPVAIYRLIGFRSFDLALAMAVLYVAVCLVLFIVIDATSFASAHRPKGEES